MTEVAAPAACERQRLEFGASGLIQYPIDEADGPDGAVLADIRFGISHGRDATDPRRITIGARPLAGSPSREVWCLPHATTAGCADGVGYVGGKDFLFAHVLVVESDDADLTRLTYQAYRRLLGVVQSSACPHPLRIWNYVHRINDSDRGIERYQAFCVGRALAFAESTIPERSLPAATAIGCDAPGLSVHLLAGRLPGAPLENPRQRSAYRYPLEYGPRAPSFARATGFEGPQQTWELAVSGTASIVGHLTMHPGSLSRQLRETIRNLQVLIKESPIKTRPRMHAAPALLKVYLRDAHRIDDVDTSLRAWIGEESRIIYLHGAICRRDLDIEIEAHFSIAKTRRDRAGCTDREHE